MSTITGLEGRENLERARYVGRVLNILAVSDFRDPEPLAIIQREATGCEGDERDIVQAARWSKDHPGHEGYIVLANDPLAFSAGGSHGAFICIQWDQKYQSPIITRSMAVFCQPVFFALTFYANSADLYWPCEHEGEECPGEEPCEHIEPTKIGVMNHIGRGCPCGSASIHPLSPDAVNVAFDTIFLALRRTLDEHFNYHH